MATEPDGVRPLRERRRGHARRSGRGPNAGARRVVELYGCLRNRDADFALFLRRPGRRDPGLGPRSRRPEVVPVADLGARRHGQALGPPARARLCELGRAARRRTLACGPRATTPRHPGQRAVSI